MNLKRQATIYFTEEYGDLWELELPTGRYTRPVRVVIDRSSGNYGILDPYRIEDKGKGEEKLKGMRAIVCKDAPPIDKDKDITDVLPYIADIKMSRRGSAKRVLWINTNPAGGDKIILLDLEKEHFGVFNSEKEAVDAEV